jgi:SSS family solute:Na+ symporter
MNLNLFDWCIVIGFLVFLLFMANYTKRFVRSVADFLAANRCAGRYMLAVSGVMSSSIGIIAWFEMYYKGGFSAVWWAMLMLPVPIIIGLSGWLIYRYRQTRVMTLAQFFEIRYSRRFRIFTGIVGFTSGVINFGIFPAIGTRCLIYFMGIPEHFSVLGVSISAYPSLMAILLSVSLYFTFTGGQIAIMITDFLQGVFCNIVFILIIISMAIKFNWLQVSESLAQAPVNASLINPFHASDVPDFNMWYFIIGMVSAFYNYMSWQGSSGFNCAAINAHEQKMGRALGNLRDVTSTFFYLLIPICAYAVMTHPDFSLQAQHVKNILSGIQSETMKGQAVVPVAAATFLGHGLLGCMCTVIMAAFIGTHTAYMHSWGSILVQDVILPFRKTPITPKQHLVFLRIAIVAVTFFVFIWSYLFKQNESIFMYFAITGAVYLGGAGAVIIGGLYWKRGTTTAAWWAMIIGSILAVSGILVRQFNPGFPINSQWIYLITMATSCGLYIGISLLGPKSEFNIDCMLHRGEYADGESEIQDTSTWLTKLGITKQLSLQDKLTYILCIGWTVLCFGIFAIGTIYNTFFNKNVSDASWLAFWRIWVIFSCLIGVLVTIWLTAGGIKDMILMFKRLSALDRDYTDDGTVIKKVTADNSKQQ